MALTCVLGTTAAQAQGVLRRVEERVKKLVDRIDEAAPADERGAVEPGYLGVIADDRQDQGRGVRILELVEGAPAQRDGLAVGDLVVAIDSQPVRSMAEMTELLEPLRAGTKVEFQVTRAGADRKLKITLGQRPKPGGRVPEFGRIGDRAAGAAEPGPRRAGAVALAARPRLGIRTQPVSAALREQLKLPEAAGAYVVAVEQGSPAEEAGLKPGSVITAVDGHAVATPDELGAAIQQVGAGGQVEITYLLRGQEAKATVTLGRAAVEEVPAGDEPLILRPAPRGSAPAAAIEEPVEAGDETKLEALLRRLEQLEDRIEKLEEKLAPRVAPTSK
jgi:predicted metalloprotease with PDZ domain